MTAAPGSGGVRETSRAGLSAWEAESGAHGAGAARARSAALTAEQASIEMMGAMLAVYPFLPEDVRLKIFADLYKSALASST